MSRLRFFKPGPDIARGRLAWRAAWWAAGLSVGCAGHAAAQPPAAAPEPPASGAAAPAPVQADSPARTGSGTGFATETGDAQLLLEMFVNGQPSGKIGEFIARGGRLFATPAELRDLGFAVPAGSAVPAIDLSSVPGLAFRVDEGSQQIFITAEIGALAAHRIGGTADSGFALQPSKAGLLVNYDAVATVGRGGAFADALVETRAFRGFAAIGSTFIVSTANPSKAVVRLDSAIEYSDAAHLRSFVAGDLITSALAWTRPVRLGGLQVSTAFAMRPDLVTYPLPTMQGRVAVPSTVDILVDGVRQLSSEVAAGPFYVPQLPLSGGARTVSVQVHDALGRSSRVDTAIYASESLLAAGLSSFSVEAGAIRHGFGQDSFGYGRAAASASYRRGIGAVTIEGHAETSSGLLMGGGGASFTLGRLAVATVAAAASSAGGRAGAAGFIAVERQTPLYRLSFTAHVTGPHFEDLASISGDRAPRLFLRASGGTSFGRFGAVDLGYILVRGAQGGGPAVESALPAAAASSEPGLSILTVDYSKSFSRRVQLSANAFRDFASRKTGVMLHVSMQLGRRRQASAGIAASAGALLGGVDIRQSGDSIGDLAWEAYVGRDPAARAFAQAQVRTPVGLFGGGVDFANGRIAAQASASGSLVWMDGSLFAANPIRDSFAIVDTAGVAGVTILQDNRVAGRTRRDGRMILTDLRSFDSNKVGIDAGRLSLTAAVVGDETLARPVRHAGVVARFEVREEKAALLTIVDESGVPIALGASARLGDSGTAEPVGYDGQVFLQDVGSHNMLAVDLADGRRCAIRFDARPQAGEIARIGPLVCRAGT